MIVQSVRFLVVDWRAGVRTPVEALKCFPSNHFQTDCLAHPTFYPVGPGDTATEV
jgi:hypothetical protein